MQDQLYKITVNVSNLSNMNPSQPAGSNKLFFGYENDEGTAWLDYSEGITGTTTGNYTYYVVPKTNRGNIFLGISNGGGGYFECEIGSVTVEHIVAAFQPMYSSVLSTVTDYYAFGSPMPGRNYNSPNYRYGMNGKEKDDEISGSGNNYDFGDRIYEARLGRLLSVDPFSHKAPFASPYSFADNNPIWKMDNNGDSTVYYTESGQFLFLSNDGLSNSVVIVKKADQIKWDIWKKQGDKSGLSHRDSWNQELRKFGLTYNTGSIKKFYNQFKNTRFVNPAGEKTKWTAEHGAHLFNKGGQMNIGDEVIAGDPENTPWRQMKGDLNDADGAIHTHPGEGGQSYYYPNGGTVDVGPSPEDRTFQQQKDPTNIHIVVSKSAIFFYGGNLKKDIVIPFNTINPAGKGGSEAPAGGGTGGSNGNGSGGSSSGKSKPMF